MSDPNGHELTSNGHAGKSQHNGVLKDKTGKFLPGTAKPPTAGPLRQQLVEALRFVEHRQKTVFFVHCWELAYKDKHVAMEMLSYILPKPKPEDASEPQELHIDTQGGPVQINYGTELGL